MDPHDRATMGEFVRRHHVHLEVEPEEATGGPGPALTGFRLRLLATADRARLAAPASAASAALLGELRAFADRIAAEAGVSDRAEAIPASRKLYQSADDRDADEVALTLRIRCDRPEHRAPGAGEDRCLAAVRARLAEVGVTAD